MPVTIPPGFDSVTWRMPLSITTCITRMPHYNILNYTIKRVYERSSYEVNYLHADLQWATAPLELTWWAGLICCLPQTKKWKGNKFIASSPGATYKDINFKRGSRVHILLLLRNLDVCIQV
jgi:hypothetical protein